MEFLILDLMDMEESRRWIAQHFHPEGLRCPRCQALVTEARLFRHTKRSQLPVYRCKRCGRTYNLYTGTVFEFDPSAGGVAAPGDGQRGKHPGAGGRTGVELWHGVELTPCASSPSGGAATGEAAAGCGSGGRRDVPECGGKRRAASASRRPAPAAGNPTARAWDV